MALRIEQDGTRFRVLSQACCTDWLPDTASNRKSMVVFFRLLEDARGKPLHTYQELAVLVDSANRQASSGHVEAFRDCGQDMLSFLQRRRKVDSQVVHGVLCCLLEQPLAGVRELRVATNAHLGREDLTDRNIGAALEQISCEPLRRVLRQRLARGEAHYQESYLLAEMMRSLRADAGEVAGLSVTESEGMRLTDPSAIRALVSPDAPLSAVGTPLQWVCFAMALYFHGVPLSVLGQWFHVHKTTVLRWLMGLSQLLAPLVFGWIRQHVKAGLVYVDEKWLKIRGKWYYWFVVLDAQTGLPVLTSLLDSRGEWACRWIGTQLKTLGHLPRAFITDGMVAYQYLKQCLGQNTRHLLCHFHHQQGITVWLKKHFKQETEEDKQRLKQTKQQMKQVLQSSDKRTVKRRFGKLKSAAEALGIQAWVETHEANMEQLLPAVGSDKFPTTTNLIERFFRQFNQFYKRRCGFFSVTSAKRELLFFLLMYLFTKQPRSGKAPLETIMPEATRMPFYQLVNDPLRLLMGRESVKLEPGMAQNEGVQCLAA